ncbi:MAG: hypothetical protein Q8941_01265 [Bacteroidota bacterium]|nr:hypothetical protein [Bacteroidota bacterium]
MGGWCRKILALWQKALDHAQQFLDSMKSAQMSRDVKQGMDNFPRYQNEQRDKQKKQAFLYTGTGTFFFVILVVGLRRSVKK